MIKFSTTANAKATSGEERDKVWFYNITREKTLWNYEWERNDVTLWIFPDFEQFPGISYFVQALEIIFQTFKTFPGLTMETLFIPNLETITTPLFFWKRYSGNRRVNYSRKNIDLDFFSAEFLRGGHLHRGSVHLPPCFPVLLKLKCVGNFTKLVFIFEQIGHSTVAFLAFYDCNQYSRSFGALLKIQE